MPTLGRWGLNSYLVRIYRRDEKNPSKIVGIVEEIGTDGKRAFECLDDLWEILSSPHTEVPRKMETTKDEK
jgi:hypothetical protein